MYNMYKKINLKMVYNFIHFFIHFFIQNKFFRLIILYAPSIAYNRHTRHIQNCNDVSAFIN